MTALVKRADECGLAWPSLTTLAADTSVGRTKVVEAVAELERLGLLHRERRSQGAGHDRNLYRLPLTPPGGSPGVPPSSHSGSPGEPAVGRTSPPGGLPLVRGADAGGSPGDHKLPSELPKRTIQGGPSPSRRRTLWHFAPEDWQPKESHRTQAEKLGVDFDRELASFRRHEFKDARSDADRAFGNWLDRADRYSRRQSGRTSTPQQGTAARVRTATLEDQPSW